MIKETYKELIADKDLFKSMNVKLIDKNFYTNKFCLTVKDEIASFEVDIYFAERGESRFTVYFDFRKNREESGDFYKANRWKLDAVIKKMEEVLRNHPKSRLLVSSGVTQFHILGKIRNYHTREYPIYEGRIKVI